MLLRHKLRDKRRPLSLASPSENRIPTFFVVWCLKLQEAFFQYFAVSLYLVIHFDSAILKIVFFAQKFWKSSLCVTAFLQMIGLISKSFVLRKVAYYEFSMPDVKETSKKMSTFMVDIELL